MHRDRFASGVFFVELASLTDPDLVPQAIADALELLVPPDDSAVTVLNKHLRDKHLLLVLDSFEHVTEAAAAVAEILATAERVNVLATSREPLRISGEHEFAVEPLELPDPNAPAGNAAVALFVDRARSGGPCVRADRRQCGGGGRDLHRSRRPAAGDRAGRGAREGPDARGDARPLGRAPPDPERGRARPALLATRP